MTDTTERTPTDYSLSDRYLSESGTVFVTGVQALARVPVEQLRRDRMAGLNTAAFLSGYPGSPLGGFDLEVARACATVPDLPIVHQPAVNEELGATSVMGSQLAQGRPDATYDGVVGFWYGKAPGLDRAGDALRHGVFAGSSSRGGAVVLVGDDPACKSSTMPSSSDASLVDLHMPILYPGTMIECVELGLHAVAMSRASGLWSSMKIVTPVADGSGTITLPAMTVDPVMPTVEIDGRQWVSTPSAQFLGQRMLEVEREFREVRLPLAQRYGVENRLNRATVDPADAWIGVVATGFTYYELLDALRRLGLRSEAELGEAGIRVLQLRMPVPFDADLIRHFARGLDEIVVVEEKNPTLEWLIKDALYGRGEQPNIVGKTHEDGSVLMRSWGRLDADAMMPGLRRRLASRLGERLVPEPAPERERTLIPLSENRTPFFCSGCPHNWGTKVPDGALVGAGTGCHGMSLLMDEDRVGETIGITAMGNEGAQWIGMAPFVETGHIFQNYGDGTFFHSAQLALQYCVGAGMNITFKILYNGTVAMTGGQDSTAPLDVPDLVTVLLAHGVSKVAITTEDTDRYRKVDLPSGVDVHDRTAIVQVQQDLAATPGVTVLIHDQFCAAELRRARKRGKLEMPTRRIVINHRVCEGCGDCGDVSNCLSVRPIETPFGRKTTIDQASCNYDESCLQGDCPAFMTVEVTTDPDRPSGTGPDSRTEVPDPTIDPTIREAGPMVRLRLAGIGGTGVVTVAQILSTAAMLDGWTIRGLDQTGLSQKAGPVLSDIVLVRGEHESSNLVGVGQAHVVLAFDGMVAAGDVSIAAADPERTTVVASTTRTPTGRMVSQPAIAYPDDDVAARLAAAARGLHMLDAAHLSDSLTGRAAQANVLLLGAAVQLGLVPVAVDAIERAIELNGVAVDENLAALDWGRRWAHDPDAVETHARSVHDRAAFDPSQLVTVPDLPASLARRIEQFDVPAIALVSMLAADLVGYQDANYAARFVDAVERIRRADQRAGTNAHALTESFARSLHKLMAYKDEYEVARLLLLPESRAASEAVGGSQPSVRWHLHPPMLKAIGLDRKLPIGGWATPALAALARAKRLRTTRLDPFGRSTMRRTEAALPAEFVDAVDRILPSLHEGNYDEAVRIAALPDAVRGYEDLKLARIAAYRSELSTAVAAFG